MSVLEFLVYENGSQKRKVSSAETVQFAALQVGTTPLPITEVAGEFDFAAKKLANIAAPVANTDASTKLYVDTSISTLAGNKADRSLGNLNAVAINTALLPATGVIDLASSVTSFRDLYIKSLRDGATVALDMATRTLKDLTSVTSVDLTLRKLHASSGTAILDYSTDIMIGSPAAVVPVKFSDANASNYVGFQAPSVVPADVLWTLPSADALVAGYVLSSNAAGILSWINPLGASPTDFADDVFRISDNGTPSKKIAFQASGITASNVRTITMPDADVDLGLLALRTLNNLQTTSINQILLPNALATLDVGSLLLPWKDIYARSLNSDTGFDLTILSAADLNLNAVGDVLVNPGSFIFRPAIDDLITLGTSSFHFSDLFVNGVTAAADLQINSPIDMTLKKIKNLAAPTLANDAATKAYVDASSAAVSDYKSHCRAATSANIALTGVHPLVTGGVTLEFLDRLLVKSQGTQADNGIYDYTDAGGGNYALVRSSDANSSAELLSAVVFVAEGTHARKPFYQNTISNVAVAQVETWNFTGQTGATYDVVGNGLKLNLAGGLAYLWFNVTDGLTQTDPTGVGTIIQVDVLLADNATALASKADAAIVLASIPGVVTSNTTGTLQVTYAPGALTDGDAGDSATTYTLVTDGLDAGLLLGTDPIVWTEFGSSSKVEYRTLSGGEITAKQITLAFTPAAPTEVALDVKGSVASFYTDDFVVSGNILDWNGLGLDGVLIAGDKLRVSYTKY